MAVVSSKLLISHNFFVKASQFTVCVPESATELAIYQCTGNINNNVTHKILFKCAVRLTVA